MFGRGLIKKQELNSKTDVQWGRGVTQVSINGSGRLQNFHGILEFKNVVLSKPNHFVKPKCLGVQ